MQDQSIMRRKVKQIIARRTPVEAIYRFLDKTIFLKSNTVAYDEKLIEQVKAKGGNITFGNGWLMIDMFGDNEEVKIGYQIFNPKTADPQKIADLLFNFFKTTLEAQGFKCEVSEI